MIIMTGHVIKRRIVLCTEKVGHSHKDVHPIVNIFKCCPCQDSKCLSGACDKCLSEAGLIKKSVEDLDYGAGLLSRSCKLPSLYKGRSSLIVRSSEKLHQK